jgi:hypothetical protein
MGNRTEQVTHTLDLDENPGLHRTGWQVQPFGKALLLAIMIAGLLGVFGQGWLSKRTAVHGRAQINYERFARFNGELKLDVTMTGVTGKSAVSFPLSYINHFEIKQIVPTPERTFIRDGQMWFVFEAEQNLQALFYMRPQQTGSVAGLIYVNEANTPIHHYIYP